MTNCDCGEADCAYCYKPEEAMTDIEKMIQDWANTEFDHCGVEFHRRDFTLGASRMYDHRQKEIDELREQVRWWIERWTCFWSVPKCKADFDRIAEAEKELNAAASRVLVK